MTPVYLWPVEHIIGHFLLNIESTADWRRRKAEEHPDDRRNMDAANGLDRLAEYVKSLDGGHPFLKGYSKLWNAASASGQADVASETETRLLGRYGFDYGSDDHEVFLNGLIEELESLRRDSAKHGYPLG